MLLPSSSASMKIVVRVFRGQGFRLSQQLMGNSKHLDVNPNVSNVNKVINRLWYLHARW